MFDLITIGDSVVDIFFIIDHGNSNCSLDRKKRKLCFNYAEKMTIEHSTHSVGGNAANVAVGAQRIGIPTAIMTEIGDDINGQVILQTLKDADVDLSLVKIHKNAETRYSVVLNYESERTILAYHTSRSYTFPTLPETKWIYYTSLGKHFEKLQKKLITYLKKNPDVRLAINPGSYQIAKGLEAIKEILPFASVLIVNKEEAAKIAEKTPRTTIKTLIKELKKKGVDTVVITDSTNGSYASDGEEMLHMPPYPIEAKAKTGAGDAFTSGFLSATILKKSLSDALRWGTANAGGVIQSFGAQEGLLTKRAITSTLKKHKNLTPKDL